MTENPNADPAPAIATLDGWTIERLEPGDAEWVAQLLSLRGHQYTFAIPHDVEVIRKAIEELVRQPWSIPLSIVRDDACTGVVVTSLPNIRSLHTGFNAMFVDPAVATLPLAMAVRHLFWSFPLRRLHTQLPDMDLTREYVELFRSVGFVDEGRLVDHAIVGGQTFSVITMGLLRPDFETWCAQHEPRLALES